MKRTSRTTLFLSPVIVISILASALAYRSKGTGSLGTATRASEMPDSEGTRRSIIAITTAPASTAKPLRFQVVKLLGQKSIKQLETQLGADVFTLVLKINRLDRKHLRNGASLIIPDAN